MNGGGVDPPGSLNITGLPSVMRNEETLAIVQTGNVNPELVFVSFANWTCDTQWEISYMLNGLMKKQQGKSGFFGFTLFASIAEHHVIFYDTVSYRRAIIPVHVTSTAGYHRSPFVKGLGFVAVFLVFVLPFMIREWKRSLTSIPPEYSSRERLALEAHGRLRIYSVKLFAILALTGTIIFGIRSTRGVSIGFCYGYDLDVPASDTLGRALIGAASVFCVVVWSVLLTQYYVSDLHHINAQPHGHHVAIVRNVGKTADARLLRDYIFATFGDDSLLDVRRVSIKGVWLVVFKNVEDRIDFISEFGRAAVPWYRATFCLGRPKSWTPGPWADLSFVDLKVTKWKAEPASLDTNLDNVTVSWIGRALRGMLIVPLFVVMGCLMILILSFGLVLNSEVAERVLSFKFPPKVAISISILAPTTFTLVARLSRLVFASGLHFAGFSFLSTQAMWVWGLQTLVKTLSFVITLTFLGSQFNFGPALAKCAVTRQLGSALVLVIMSEMFLGPLFGLIAKRKLSHEFNIDMELPFLFFILVIVVLRGVRWDLAVSGLVYAVGAFTLDKFKSSVLGVSSLPHWLPNATLTKSVTVLNFVVLLLLLFYLPLNLPIAVLVALFVCLGFFFAAVLRKPQMFTFLVIRGGIARGVESEGLLWDEAESVSSASADLAVMDAMLASAGIKQAWE